MVKEHAQSRQPEMKEKMDTRTRMDPGAPLMVNGGGLALFASVAAECNRISGQELTEEAERNFAGLAHKAKVWESEALAHFKVFYAREIGHPVRGSGRFALGADLGEG